jgi:hypothetical protein
MQVSDIRLVEKTKTTVAAVDDRQIRKPRRS